MGRADIGPRPENAQQVVRDYIGAQLRDPYSAVYTFNYGPERGYWTGLGTDYGWVVCGTVNAKNGFGGYVGEKYFRIMISHGKVLGGTASVVNADFPVCTLD